ncbi:MAG TPA: AmmeMemoRadiSam system radical SAM enzyme [Bacteroidales bacterium]|nr:AmmeMemoRadiSam system radical SAM enzyme [Bacteroidales bacterium]
MEARYYKKEGNSVVRCMLCPHQCSIEPDQKGICGVRLNKGGKLVTQVYGVISGFGLDPVEKKPLYHFFPGYNILSAGSYGCNFSCFFCQNHSISQVNDLGVIPKGKVATPDQLISQARQAVNNVGVAFTYNEPSVWFEFMYDTAVLANRKKLRTAMVTNGYINADPLKELLKVIDAFNIDLKSFDDSFYRQHSKATLKPVLRSILDIHRSGRHLELTMLIIPTLNDQIAMFRDCVKWIAENTGRDTVLHLSRYFPRYKSSIPATAKDKLDELFNIALEYLNFVYMGNIDGETGQNTVCPDCASLITKRVGYQVINMNSDDKGNCSSCGRKIYNYFTF